ncbi:hypothetical protein H1R20_g6249, partial [Candolleomyces eurysporus]
MASPSKGKSTPRLRRTQPEAASSSYEYDQVQEDEHHAEIYQTPGSRSEVEKFFESPSGSVIVVTALTALAFALRFYKISHPDQVVFDEVHFGKFAAYYITHQYYFDVHPPLAKLLFGLAGWFVGFDGSFLFENIGDSYTTNNVPYVGMRALPAVLGSLTVPVVYAIMKESGYSTVIAAFSAALILFDNAHVAQSRLILLDAALIFFMSLTIYSYIKFRKFRYSEFTVEWWTWLLLTGFFMACTWASKVNGILTVFCIGVAVLIELWDILDVRKEGHTMDYFYSHFLARAGGLILWPFIVYLSFFWIHFRVLSQSGPGDSFMSPAFQETLAGNELLMQSHDVYYYDILTFRHKDTKVYLHSHPDKYPLQYEDGRVSSQGQQVTGYAHNDTNNHWRILPTKSLPETGRGRIVRNNDVVQLLHMATNTLLLTHDVASPLMPTNQEFTTWSKEDYSRHNDTLFQIQLAWDAPESEPFKSKSGYFKLIHMPTRVALWTHPKPLPEWAFKQQEINGNKNPSERSAIWYAEDIIADQFGDDPADRDEDNRPVKKPKSMNFFKKYAELQLLMFQHNAGLTASHPYASGPINWPFLISGISFWTDNDTKKQIYLTGNVIGWWTCVVGLSIFVGVVVADLLARRRAMDPIPDPVRNRLWNNTGFFLIVWAVHYVPFFLMNRQLFVHHYLPSHLASALIAGSMLSFVLSETINYPISHPTSKTRLRPSQYADVGYKGLAIFAVYSFILFMMFIFIAPLTYGTPGLTGEQVNSKRLLSSWTLHFAAKKTHDI